MGFVFFNDTATTEIYTLSLHDALPIWVQLEGGERRSVALVKIKSRRLVPQVARLRNHIIGGAGLGGVLRHEAGILAERSEEHTSELQSRQYLVCRLLLEKKKNYLTHLL